MMKYIILFSLMAFSLNLLSQDFNEEQTEIAKTIQVAYAEGLQNEGDSAKIDQGFHPDFNLLGLGTVDALRIYPIKVWRKRQIENRASGKLPRPTDKAVSLEFIFIDITEDVAVAKLKYFEGEEHTYTDYISLYKYESGWKIVSKIYHKIAD